METDPLDHVEIMPTNQITDSLPPIPDIPDIPDIPENVTIVTVAALPVTSEELTVTSEALTVTSEALTVTSEPLTVTSEPLTVTSEPLTVTSEPLTVTSEPLTVTSEALPDTLEMLPDTSEALPVTSDPVNTFTVTSRPARLTYITQGNVSYRCQSGNGRAPNATTTTFNVPTATLEPPPTPMIGRRPRLAVSGTSPALKQKTRETLFLTPLPVTGNTRTLTRITKNVPKPKPKPSNSEENKIIKALLAQNSTPYLTRAAAPTHRNLNIRPPTQTRSVKKNILSLPVSESLPVPLSNSPPDRLLMQRPNLRSAFVKTTTATDFIPRSSTVDTVMTTHVTTTTAITTPMTAGPQLSYAIPPIRVATTAETTATTTIITSSTGQSIVLISSPSSRARSARATQSKTNVPLQHLSKHTDDLDAAAAKKIRHLVRSKALPPSPDASVTTPVSITMLGPHGSINPTASVATSVQRPSVDTRAKTPNYTQLEPGEITRIRRIPPRSFPGTRSSCVAHRHASTVVSMQQKATIISKIKLAKHTEHHAESQARGGIALSSKRELQYVSSLAALQDATHARLVAECQETTRKHQEQEARLKAAVVAQNAQALPAPLHLPITTQLQIATLGPTQTASLAQPHATLNVQLVTPAQAQLLADATAHHHTPSQGQVHEIPQTEAQADTLAASRPQDEPMTNSELQGQPWATSQEPDQPLATFDPQRQYLPISQAPSYILATSQSQDQALITSQWQRLAESQSQGPILVAPQRHTLLATTQSLEELLATSQEQTLTTLPTQPNTTPPVQKKSNQRNATLIAQLNAPPQVIISRGQQNVPRMQLHGTQTQLKTSEWRQQAASPCQIQTSSPPQQSEALDQPSPRIRRRVVLRTNIPPLDTTPVIKIASNETVDVSTSLNEPLPSTSTDSQQIGEEPSSSIHTTSTLTLPTGTTLIMPHYKTTVFKNLSTIGNTSLSTPTTTTSEIMVMRRPATFSPARRSFPTSTHSSTAMAITTTGTTTSLIHIVRTIPRHMLGSLNITHMLPRLEGPKPEVPMQIITPKEPESEEE